MNTPICDFVRGYAAKQPLRLHMPGHKGVGPLGVEALDITEIPGADVLYAPDGIIAESESNAAALFGSAKTVYSTEGSSLCIRAMLYLAQLWAKAQGRKPFVLAGRNAHKTFLSAVALLDLDVGWLSSEGEKQSVVSCVVRAESLDHRLSAMAEKPIAVYITSPDYLGNISEIAALSAVCHQYGALLLVDNAHGAYLHFMSTPRHPLDLGADLCCDSAHKTLGVLTGGAYLHLAKSAPPMLRDAANRAMALFASTSPSYLILQSLDAANAALSDYCIEDIMSTSRRTASLRAALAAEGWTLTGDEPLKLTLSTKPRGYTGVEVAALLERERIYCEFADPDYLVWMVSPQTPESTYDVLLNALRSIPPRSPITDTPPMPGHAEHVLSPRESMLAPSETLPVEQSIGRVLASPGVSCPPAVPIVVCGEQIDEAAVNAFRYYGIDRIEVVREAIIAVNADNISVAGAIHAAAWQASHRSFCTQEFLASHTPERQTGYLREKLLRGSRIFLLLDGSPVALVSVTGSLIEDLYVLPDCQNRGFGTKLLRHAIQQCDDTPTLWILENNTGAARLYERMGFVPTGQRHSFGQLDEIEYQLT
ncbi:MAG: GNAT family N-acetyltransferase [Oscillospiraceae bacterium]|nr:GNAT family N-acetyltransferase [Oscillospiraceae bacterium]